MSRNLRFLTVLVLAAAALLAQTTPTHFDGKTWWHYVSILAADDKMGRETGSRGLIAAEAYAAAQLLEAGLEPAGTQGYYQPVKFQSRQIIEKESSLALLHDGKIEPLTLGEDA